MRSALALVVVLLGVASLSSAHGAEAAPAAGPRVTMFGDSIADSLNYVPDARTILSDGIDLRLELAPCRKLVPIGCAYMGGRPPSVLDIVKESTLAQLGNIVVVAVGYNDPENNYETDMAQVVNALVDKGVGHVIWLTLREQTDDYRKINRTIEAQAPRWPELRIADWERASRGKDWFNPDGLHLNAAGALGMATLIRPFVLTACGSALQGPRRRCAAQRGSTEREREARRREHRHLPARHVVGTASDRLLVPLDPRDTGAHARRRPHARPRESRPRAHDRLPDLGGQHQRRDRRDLAARPRPLAGESSIGQAPAAKRGRPTAASSGRSSRPERHAEPLA